MDGRCEEAHHGKPRRWHTKACGCDWKAEAQAAGACVYLCCWFLWRSGRRNPDREHGPGQGFLADVCKGWEREATAAREFGLRVVLLRVATVLGRDGGALKPMLVPFKMGVGGKFGSGKQWMPWIQLDDLVSLYVFAAQTESVEGPLNAAAPETVTNEQFTKTLGKVLGRPTLIPAPRFALRLALGELANFVLSSQRVVPEAATEAGFQFRYGQLEAALRAVLD